MAKRRYKNKAKRGFVGLNRKLSVNGDSVSKTETSSKMESVKDGIENIGDDPQGKVQITEREKLDSESTEHGNNGSKLTELSQNKCNKMKGRKEDSLKKQISQGDGNTEDEVLIFPKEVDGETCIDVQCGPNEAFMYLAKLCVGSRGACIKFSDKWLTPNEFQLVSGRETAKDWKRSIRHKGRSLKLLIGKGLITVQSISPKKANAEKEKKNKNTVISEGGNGESKEIDREAIKPPAEPQIRDQQKKRGRKPKKQRGRRPADIERNVVSMETEDSARTETETSVTTSGVNEQIEGSVDKNSDSKDNSPAKADDGQSQTPGEDTRTDEEKRLDEFVKSLKLTKTTVATSTTMAPSTDAGLSTAVISTPEQTIQSKNDVTNETSSYDVIDDDVDPEMPVLQKEADVGNNIIADYDNKQIDISVSVDALNSTVTPPPTPPSERLSIEQKLETDERIETFKSTLSSPSVGLKLTINREKVKVNSDSDFESKNENPSIMANEKCESENVPSKNPGIDVKPKMQSLLLQDALQSAKKYKEQLQQNRHISPPSNIKSTPSNPHRSFSGNSHPIVSPKSERKHDGLIRKQPSMKKEYFSADKRHIAHAPNIGPMPSVDDMQRLSFPEMMSAMTSMYGPLSFPIDPKEASMSSVHEIQQKYDMLRLMTAQGHVTGQSPSSALMYQQLLLAMTHQLYNTCNIPAMMVPGTGNLAVPDLKMSNANPTHSNTSRKSDSRGANASIKHRFPLPPHTVQNKGPEETVRHKVISGDGFPSWRPSSESAYKSRAAETQAGTKRKFIEVDADGALDLSMKKTKQDHNLSSANMKLSSNASSDVPLDFSVKRGHVGAHVGAHPHGKQGLHVQNGSYINGYHSHKSISSISQTPVSSNTSIYSNSGKHGGDGRCGCISGTDIVNWSVEQVCSFLKATDGCAAYVKTFHDQGISGRLLPYLTIQHLTRTLGMSLGPALTLLQAVERKCKEKRTSVTSSPCMECTSRPLTAPMPIYT